MKKAISMGLLIGFPTIIANEVSRPSQRTTRISECHGCYSPRHNKLITALRTAVENGEGMLDKEATNHDDLGDAFRLSLMFWHQQGSIISSRFSNPVDNVLVRQQQSYTLKADRNRYQLITIFSV